ncbi:MAG: tetratricopeptide repeat protein [Candidatus Methylomirabilales bacterium]
MRKPRNIIICLISLLFLLGSGAGAEQEASKEKSQRAEKLYNTGYMMTLLGQFEKAIQLYEQSLEIQPTAEAHTYMGWTYSHMRNLKRAIEEAEKAIRIDPDFGNPYNDIGVYLIDQGKDDEAIPYLQKAMRAKRYCCYQFPHYNMGRIYLRKKMYEKARREFQKSLAIDPDYAPAADALELLKRTGMQEI